MLVTSSLLVAVPVDAEGAPPSTEEKEIAPLLDESSKPAWEPPPTSMPPSERARVWWLRAQELEGATQFRESANAYRRSYEARPTMAALYNMALAHDYARQPLDAIAAYRRYADQAQIDAVERAQVLERISEIEGEVARIVITLPSDFSSGAVTIDGVEVTPATQGNLVLPGPHDVAISDEAGEAIRQRVVVVAGTRVVVRFDEVLDERLTKDSSRGATTTETDTPAISARERQRMRMMRRGIWVAVGLTAASGASLLGVGIATLGAKRQFEGSLCDGPCPEGVTYDADAASRFYQLRTASNVLVGITAASALTLTVLAIMGVKGSDNKSSDQTRDWSPVAAARWKLRPTLGGLRFDF